MRISDWSSDVCSSDLAMARLVPQFVGGSATGDAVTGDLMSLREMLVKLLPILLLIVAVLGGIYGGFFNATDAGAVGAAGALVIALIKRRPDRRQLWPIGRASCRERGGQDG